MMKAANSLKAVRTNSVDTVHEIGTEVTSKQVIANTNRCHSLTYHYFEVLEDVEVTTRPIGASIFLLLPLDVPPITPEWVLCNECTIRPALPCTTFYRGLDAAKLMKTQEIRSRLLPATCSRPATPGGSADARTSGGEIDALVEAVLRAYCALRDAKIVAAPNNPGVDFGGAISKFGAILQGTAAAVDNSIGNGIGAIQSAVDTGKSDLESGLRDLGKKVGVGNPPPRLMFSVKPSSSNLMFATMPGFGTTEGGPGSWLYWSVVDKVAPELRDALDFLARAFEEIRGVTGVPDREAAARRILAQFFGRLGNLDALFAKIDGATAAVTVGVTIGIPYAHLLQGIAVVLELAGLGDTVPDDEGLKGKLLALKATFDAEQIVQPMLGAPAPGDAADRATDPNDPCANRYCADPCALAEAELEWNRLACHMNGQILYYMQAVWAHWKDVQVMELAASLGIPLGAIEYGFSGFQGDRGAVRVIDLKWLKAQGGFDWDAELAGALQNLPAIDSDLVTLPTQGMVVEPALGKCNGCEDFISEHRRLDLESRRAEVGLAQSRAAQAAEEVRRLKLRNDGGDLSDPTPYEGAHTSVEVKPATP
jgi:hypothetical protein